MAAGFSEYATRSQQLAATTHRLLESFRNPNIDRNIAIQGVRRAADTGQLAAKIRGFSETPSEPRPPIAAEDALANILLEIQSANVLISTGIALNQHEGGSDVSMLNRSVEEIEKSRAEVVRPLTAAELRFDPAKNVRSKDLETAKNAFRTNAEGVLVDITDDTVSVISSVFEQLKKLDASKIVEGIGKIGESIPAIAAAGQFIRQGLEKLKNAIEAIANLFGKDAVAAVKEKVKSIWDKFTAGDFTSDAVAWLLNIEAAKKAIEACLARPNVTIAAWDTGSNELPALSASFKKTVKICRGLIGGLVLAGTIVGFLHFAAPWIPVAFAAGYGAMVAAAIIVGSNYAGSGRLAHWMRGVATIADGIQPASSSSCT